MEGKPAADGESAADGEPASRVEALGARAAARGARAAVRDRDSARRRSALSRLGVAAGALGGSLLFAFLALPVVSLFVTASPRELLAGLRHPVAAPALALSLATSLASLIVVIAAGTPLAYWLARGRGPAVAWVGRVVQLPIVLPPAVAGLALLFAFGRRGLLGGALDAADLLPAFSVVAVVMAQVFVGAPFYVQAAASAFGALDERLFFVARTFGASAPRVFFAIALPLARPGLVAGAALAWARALGEFGATLMFAGNLPGRTQTLPLAIYTALESDPRAAQALAVLLVLVGIALLGAVRVLRPETASPHAGRAAGTR